MKYAVKNWTKRKIAHCIIALNAQEVKNMIKEKMQNALNKQINAELYSSYLYLSMSAYFESIYLRGFAHWMRVQAKEEVGHVMRIY